MQDFATQAESIFRGTDRHAHLDKSYSTLVAVIFEQIARVAQEHPKTPREVVMLGKLHCFLIKLYRKTNLSLNEQGCQCDK